VDRADVFTQLDAIHAVTPIEVIIENGEGGVPALAASWARVRGVSCWRVPADEARHGGAAFGLRDERMLNMCQPDAVLVLPGAEAMKAMAKALGVKVRLPLLPGADPNQTDFLAAA
jgi:hypothetical protein